MQSAPFNISPPSDIMGGQPNRFAGGIAVTDRLAPAPWNVIEPDPDDRRYVIIHNCYTGATFRLPKKEAGDPLGSGSSRRTLDFFRAEKLMVDPAKVAGMLEERLFEIMRGMDGSVADAVLIPTHGCQLGCVYCFNAEVRKAPGKKRAAAEAIAGRLTEFFAGTFAQTWRLKVTGGGEPMLAFGYTLKIIRLVGSAARRHGRFFEAVLVSNGVSLTPSRARKLLAAGVKSAQITLDPDHDKRRTLKNGKGTLEAILESIKALPEEMRVKVISNVSPGDEKAFARLMKKLKPLKGRIASISPGLISGKIPPALPSANGKKMSRMYGPREIDVILACHAAAEEAGFEAPLDMPRIICEAFMDSCHFSINFQGQTAICPGLEGSPEFQERGRSRQELERLFDMRLASPQWKEHCYENQVPCPYLPKCWGGCRMISVIQGAGWGAINCEKYMFERFTRHLMTK